jgi:hypothetical protein
MAMERSHLADLLADISNTLDSSRMLNATRVLVAIVDEEAGGIVAYALDWENADNITTKLNK